MWCQLQRHEHRRVLLSISLSTTYHKRAEFICQKYSIYTIYPFSRLCLFASSSSRSSLTGNSLKVSNKIFRCICSSHIGSICAFVLTWQTYRNPRTNKTAMPALSQRYQTKTCKPLQTVVVIKYVLVPVQIAIWKTQKKQAKITCPLHQLLIWTFVEQISITHPQSETPGVSYALAASTDTARHTWHTSPCSMLRFCLIKALWIKHEVIIVAPDGKRSREWGM